MEKKRVKVCVSGETDFNEFYVECTEEQVSFLEMVSDMSKRNAMYMWEPIIELYEE